jgi:putative addiction module component (TIGR02574 family)
MKASDESRKIIEPRTYTDAEAKAEIPRRVREFERNPQRTIPAEEVFARLRLRLRARSSRFRPIISKRSP